MRIAMNSPDAMSRIPFAERYAREYGSVPAGTPYAAAANDGAARKRCCADAIAICQRDAWTTTELRSALAVFADSSRTSPRSEKCHSSPFGAAAIPTSRMPHGDISPGERLHAEFLGRCRIDKNPRNLLQSVLDRPLWLHRRTARLPPKCCRRMVTHEEKTHGVTGFLLPRTNGSSVRSYVASR